ncbi:hypothetical protein CEXT_615691 [Caerostris extrusa]|uniref:Uncharacterized protein n=1 Tax=Caerostris extrusa TaxID=172846 RepID=A0AAV4P4N6_CAEEX|nr:hypothetical protein CEXT_615691 [Caerostris extrusa]
MCTASRYESVSSSTLTTRVTIEIDVGLTHDISIINGFLKSIIQTFAVSRYEFLRSSTLATKDPLIVLLLRQMLGRSSKDQSSKSMAQTYAVSRYESVSSSPLAKRIIIEHVSYEGSIDCVTIETDVGQIIEGSIEGSMKSMAQTYAVSRYESVSSSPLAKRIIIETDVGIAHDV